MELFFAVRSKKIIPFVDCVKNDFIKFYFNESIFSSCITAQKRL